MKSVIILSLLYFLGNVDGLKVLVCLPLPVRSISILGQSVVQYLIEAGHEVSKNLLESTKTTKQKHRKNWQGGLCPAVGRS